MISSVTITANAALQHCVLPACGLRKMGMTGGSVGVWLTVEMCVSPSLVLLVHHYWADTALSGQLNICSNVSVVIRKRFSVGFHLRCSG